MKYLSILLFSCVSVNAQLNTISPFGIKGTNTPAAGGGGGDNLVREEKFSNASGYDLTWTRDTGTWFNPDFTGWYAYSPHSLLASNSGSFKYITNSIPKVTTNWYAVSIVVESSASGNIAFGLGVFDSVDLAVMKPRTDNQWGMTLNNADQGAFGSVAWTASRTNRVWVWSVHGTSNDGVFKYWTSDTTGTWSDSFLRGTVSGIANPVNGNLSQADMFTIQTANNDVFKYGTYKLWQQGFRPSWDIP